MTKLHSLLQQYRPRPDLKKGAHFDVPLTNSKIGRAQTGDKPRRYRKKRVTEETPPLKKGARGILSTNRDAAKSKLPQSEFKTLDDAARIVGCWKAQSKQGLVDAPLGETQRMQRAVAFYQVIDPKLGAASHKVRSRNIADLLKELVHLDCALSMNTDFTGGEGLRSRDCGVARVAEDQFGERILFSFQDWSPFFLKYLLSRPAPDSSADGTDYYASVRWCDVTDCAPRYPLVSDYYGDSNLYLTKVSSCTSRPFRQALEGCNEEPEGVSYFDLNAISGYHCTRPRGELTAIILHNDLSDDATFHHYTRIIDVNPADGIHAALFNYWNDHGAWDNSRLFSAPATYGKSSTKDWDQFKIKIVSTEKATIHE